ncbi:putative non-specific serine/threonine protein kinase [Helianthus annuus]|nr:putative non-specific serine/threonine protein kinase [Helianthus annuus]
MELVLYRWVHRSQQQKMADHGSHLRVILPLGSNEFSRRIAFCYPYGMTKYLIKTIVWYPKGGPMVPRGSKVELRDGCGLVLSDPQGKEVWTSGSNISDRAYGFMNDTGNFVIVDGISRKVWESFRFPTDTILPTQVMEIYGELISKISETNFTLGRFQLKLLPDGNLILRKRDITSGVLYNTYYRSNTRDDINKTNSGLQLIYEETGHYKKVNQ